MNGAMEKIKHISYLHRLLLLLLVGDDGAFCCASIDAMIVNTNNVQINFENIFLFNLFFLCGRRNLLHFVCVFDANSSKNLIQMNGNENDISISRYISL